MTPTEISAEYTRRYNTLSDQYGRRLSVNDREFWDLENWYSSEHQALIRSRPVPLKEPHVKTPASVARTAAPVSAVPAPSSVRLCACGKQIFKRKPGRGRYPSKCSVCRGES